MRARPTGRASPRPPCPTRWTHWSSDGLGMPLGQRQLFIYWRVAGSDLPAALNALRDWQAGLTLQHPALRCGLYQRMRQRASGCHGDGKLCDRVGTAAPRHRRGAAPAHRPGGHALLERWLRGARHVEVFDALHT